MSVMDEFDSWKQFLANRLDQAEEHGMSKGTIENLAHQVGDYLAQNINAPNDELHAIQELWNVAKNEEQQVLANLMIKLVQKES